MKTITRCLLFFIPLFLHSQTSIFEHEWIGQVSILGESHYAALKSKNDTITMMVRSSLSTTDHIVEKARITDDELQFTISKGIETWNFQVEKQAENRLEGIVQVDDFKGGFIFYKRLKIEKEEWQPYIGNFQLPSGGFIKITQGRNFTFFHSSIGQEETILKKIGEHRFLSNSLELLQFSDFRFLWWVVCGLY